MSFKLPYSQLPLPTSSVDLNINSLVNTIAVKVSLMANGKKFKIDLEYSYMHDGAFVVLGHRHFPQWPFQSYFSNGGMGSYLFNL